MASFQLPASSFQIRASLLFILAVLVISWFYDYPRVIQLGPAGHHYWRQSDGASLALSYYENGMRFFKPRVHHMAGGDNCTVAEFPVLYYTVAALYHFFGPRDAVFRLFNFLVFLSGLYFFFRLLLQRTGDVWLSLFPPLLLLGSPLLAFYAPGFLPNTTALGLIFIAAFLFFRYLDTQRMGWFYAAAGVTLLAGLLKVSILIPFLAMAGAALLSRLLLPRSPESSRLPAWPYLTGATAVILGSVAAWYLWARHYNESHQSGYFFLIDIKPIWNVDENYRVWTNDELLHRQRYLYFTSYTLAAFFLLGLLLLLLPHLMPAALYLSIWLAFLGSLAFLLLFYGQLAIHHYYFIDLMPLPALVLASALWLVRRRLPALSGTWTLRFLLLLFLLSNVRETKRQLGEYYRPDSNYIVPEFTSLNKHRELEAFLQEHGIRYPESAVVIGDISPNAALYYLNLRGWNLTGPTDDEKLRQFIQWGASYLVILDPNYLSQNPLPQMTARPIGVFDGRIGFYDLRGVK